MSNPVLALLHKYALPIARAVARRTPGVDLMLDLQGAFTDQVQEERIETLEDDVALFAAQVDHMESFRELVLGEMAALRESVKTALERDPNPEAPPVTDELVEERTAAVTETLLDLPRNATFARNAVESVARSFSDQETMRVVRPDVRRTIARTLFPNANQTTGLRTGDSVPEWRRWKLVKPLGRGGFGEVWLARYDEILREVAVKFCDDESKARQLEREIQAVRSLSHPRIVPLVEADLKAFPPWIAFEYVPGGTLTDWIRAKPRSQEDIVARLDEVLQALAHAHKKGVWHRDVKPDNVLIDASGRARLTDFGIGKVIAEERQRLAPHSLGLSMTISGTTMYMPPEVLNAQRPADARADVYAIGTLAWQLLVGDPTAARPDDWTEDLREAGAERFAAFLVKCFARYERRLENADEVLKALRAFQTPPRSNHVATPTTTNPLPKPPGHTAPTEQAAAIARAGEKRTAIATAEKEESARKAFSNEAVFLGSCSNGENSCEVGIRLVKPNEPMSNAVEMRIFDPESPARAKLVSGTMEVEPESGELILRVRGVRNSGVDGPGVQYGVTNLLLKRDDREYGFTLGRDSLIGFGAFGDRFKLSRER